MPRLVKFKTGAGEVWINPAMVTDLDRCQDDAVRIYLLGGVDENPNCRVVLGQMDEVAARLAGDSPHSLPNPDVAFQIGAGGDQKETQGAAGENESGTKEGIHAEGAASVGPDWEAPATVQEFLAEADPDSGPAEFVKCGTFKTEMDGGRTIRIGAQFWRDTCAERDALAAQVLELRGALEEQTVEMEGDASELCDGKCKTCVTAARYRTLLSLPLPAAAERVAEWQEKAELLDAMEANGWGVVHGVGQWFVQVRSGHGTVSLSSGTTAIEALRGARGGR